MAQTSKSQTQDNTSGGFAGTLRNIQLTDVIQMCCLAGASLCIRVNKDNDHGMIYVQEGEVVHAQCKSTEGVQAFFTILGWHGGQFETLEAPAIEKPTIKEPCQFLLMEAMRLADEQAPEEKVGSADAEEAQADKLRVLIVDDSAIMSKILMSMLCADPSLEVVGCAKNGEEALRMMKQLEPDLITMDVNMPVMDGSTALKHIMIESPSPVLIMSNLGPSSYATILTFLNLGAVDFMSKPVKHKNIVLQQQRMVDRVHIASKAKVKRFQRFRRPILDEKEFIPIDEHQPCQVPVIVNSGVGGYLEMVNVLTALPKSSKASVLSIQSIPPHFAPTLSSFLNARSRYDIHPLAPESVLCPGRGYICTNGIEIKIDCRDGLCVLDPLPGMNQDGKEDRSFDHFIQQILQNYNEHVVLILLSGAELGSMEGLRELRKAGGVILAPKLAGCILPATLE
ncbi:MAG: response regulator, partial [Desulfosarcinaceae bacterium]